MADSVGIAMVGCGQIAEAHLKAVAGNDGARLAAAVDSVEERAQSAGERYDAARWTTDYDSVLADDAVDAVVLCLPHDLHLPFTVKAAEAGKHILVEKPMALNEAEARQMVEAADAAGVKLMVGQSTRFKAPMQKAKEIVSSGGIGEVFNVSRQTLMWVERLSTDWRRDGGACGGLYLPLFGSHDVDHMLWLLEDTPSSIWASVRSTKVLSDGESEGAIGMRFADGKTASIAFSMRCRNRRVETALVGTEGSLTIGWSTLTLNGEETKPEEGAGAFVRQMDAFVDSIVRDTEPAVPGRDVLRVMRTLDLARASSERGEELAWS